MLYFVSHTNYLFHRTGQWHPEQPARVAVIDNYLIEMQIKTSANTLVPRLATRDEILLCHREQYYEVVCNEVAALANKPDLTLLSTGDVVISAQSLDIALLAVGGCLVAIDKAMSSPNTHVFCIVRPPGHHACSDRGMGFCLFNNIAIAARYAQKNYGLKRILIVDWDVHHGNGTQEIFYHDPSVFYFSTHEKNLYPLTGHSDETGDGPGKGFTLNCPISAGSQSRYEVLKAFGEQLVPKMQQFKPELVLISAGFDAHVDDPLGHFNLNDQDFADLTKIVREIADKYAKGRIVSILEGGYNLQALATASLAHVQSLKPSQSKRL